MADSPCNNLCQRLAIKVRRGLPAKGKVDYDGTKMKCIGCGGRWFPYDGKNKHCPCCNFFCRTRPRVYNVRSIDNRRYIG